MLVSTEWLGVRVWGSYEKDCCNPMITVSTQNRKVLISPEKGRNNVSWKTLNCSIHLCLTEESKHTDSSVVQISCYGETESHLVSHISCVHATVWSTTREEKTFQGRDYSCKIWGCSFCRTCYTWKSCYFLFKTLLSSHFSRNFRSSKSHFSKPAQQLQPSKSYPKVEPPSRKWKQLGFQRCAVPPRCGLEMHMEGWKE